MIESMVMKDDVNKQKLQFYFWFIFWFGCCLGRHFVLALIPKALSSEFLRWKNVDIVSISPL